MSLGGTDAPPAPAAGAVPRDQAIDALRRILASDAFAVSPRARGFLAFVVRETLDGRGPRLKERTVARGALDRSAAFDPRSDAAVRVQARRVRLALEKYYADEGSGDEVRISLPKGSYVPVISFAPVEPQSDDGACLGSTLGPGVALVHFTRPSRDTASAAVALALTESLAGALASFPGIRVVGPVDDDEPAPTAPSERRLGARLDVQYLMRGAVIVEDGGMLVTVRLVDARSGAVVWAETFDRPNAEVAGFPGLDELVRRVAGVVGDYSGAVLRHAARSGGETSHPVVWAAMLEFYEGLERSTPESAARLHRSLLDSYELEPRNSLLLSMLASTESFLATNAPDVDREQMLDAAEAHARAALVIDPTSSHALLVLGATALSRGNEQVCRGHVRLAVELSPWNPSILYGAGWLLGMAGDFDDGTEMIRESVRLNPDSPTLRYMYLAAAELVAGDHAAALADVMRYPHADEFWQPLLLALALDGLGYRDEAAVELAKATALAPDLRRAVRESPEFPRSCIEFLGVQLERLIGGAERRE